MQRAIITPATLPAAALTEVKDWLGVTTSADDAQLTSLLRCALDLCESFTGTMPLEQGCEAILPVATDWQDLPARPVQAITLVQGIPAEGARFALPVSNYALDLSAAGVGRVRVLNPGAAGRIAVRFTAGLAPSWSALPEALRHGAVRLAAHQYRQRDGGSGDAVPPTAVAALWRPWRRLRLA